MQSHTNTCTERTHADALWSYPCCCTLAGKQTHMNSNKGLYPSSAHQLVQTKACSPNTVSTDDQQPCSTTLQDMFTTTAPPVCRLLHLLLNAKETLRCAGSVLFVCVSLTLIINSKHQETAAPEDWPPLENRRRMAAASPVKQTCGQFKCA